MTSVTTINHGTVRLLQFSAPPQGIMSAGGIKQLAKAFDEACNDNFARAIVIAGGDPGVFIRHYDLGSILKAADALRGGIIDSASFLKADFARLTDTIAACPLPVIAAINGICMGGGFEIALACDIRIAQYDVEHIGLPEIRVDILPGGGGTQRLARLIGESATLDMALRGRTVSARRAYELGIIGDVVDDAVAAALDLAETLSNHDPEALATIKTLVRASHEAPIADGLARERLAFANHLKQSDQALASLANCLASGTMLEEVKL